MQQVLDWLKTGAPVDQTPTVLKPRHSTTVHPDDVAYASSVVEEPGKKQVAKMVLEDDNYEGLEDKHVVAKNENRLPTLRATEANKKSKGGSSRIFFVALAGCIPRMFGG